MPRSRKLIRRHQWISHAEPAFDRRHPEIESFLVIDALGDFLVKFADLRHVTPACHPGDFYDAWNGMATFYGIFPTLPGFSPDFIRIRCAAAKLS